MSALLFEPHEDPGKKAAAVLAVAVHVFLLVLLIYGIRWQTRSLEAVEVELIRTAPAVAARPPPEAPVPHKPVPQPVAKAEPKVEAPPKTAPSKPDIALKEKEKPKAEPKPQPKPEPRTETKPKPAPDHTRSLIEEELKTLQQQRDRQQASRELEQLTTPSSAQATADYIGRIRGKIKGNIVLPPDLPGNPEAIFEVVQLPSGEILSVRLQQSSGHAAYDSAVERAILKSSPLPKPEHGELFTRTLKLKFRPLEEP